MNTITINNNTNYKDYSYLYEVLEYALELENINNAVFSVILVGEEEIKSINKDYRNKDNVTDVISFAFEDDKELVYNEFRLLGDIYICIPKMIAQAIEYGHSEKRELSFLVIHGLLHLLGYNHETREEEKLMNEVLERVLNGKNIKRKD